MIMKTKLEIYKEMMQAAENFYDKYQKNAVCGKRVLY